LRSRLSGMRTEVEAARHCDGQRHHATCLSSAQSSARSNYCIGRLKLAVHSVDDAFTVRFRWLYRECMIDPTDDPDVELRVEHEPSHPHLLAITLTPAPEDGAQFLAELFTDRDLVPPLDALEDGINFQNGVLLVRRDFPWQQVVATFAISHTLRLQSDLLVFHAAAVGIGNRGVVLMGAKGSGKTTLSLALACRGHSFLADEWAVLSSDNLELLPLRRSVSIRPGPHCAGVQNYLSAAHVDTAVLADGSIRVRVPAGAIFPRAVARPVPLTDVFFVRGFGERPGIAHFQPNGDSLPPLTPVISTLWKHEPARRAFQLLKAISAANCFELQPGGSPDDTADAIEKVVKEMAWA
jgi:hypothetical protein